MRLNLLIFLGVAVLYGCATPQRFQAVLDKSIGKPEIEVIRHLGPPHNVYEIDGSKFLTYRRSQNVTTPHIPPTYNTTLIGNTVQTVPVGGAPSTSYINSCEFTFEIREGVVVGTRYIGNACLL